MNIEAPATITVDGKAQPIAGFPETVQRLVAIHTAWRNDLQTERLAVAKTEAACRALDVELQQAVTAVLKPPAPPVPVEPVAPSVPPLVPVVVPEVIPPPASVQ